VKWFALFAGLFLATRKREPEPIDVPIPTPSVDYTTPEPQPSRPVVTHPIIVPSSTTPGPDTGWPPILWGFNANPGMKPQTPSQRIYQLFRAEIDAAVFDINESTNGLRVGLNDWWRSTATEVGEELSQHLAGLAIDFQGPDQEMLAQRLQKRGWTIVRASNAGQTYRHIHAQRYRAGYLAGRGFTRATLA
jgi:hypothetical protein